MAEGTVMDVERSHLSASSESQEFSKLSESPRLPSPPNNHSEGGGIPMKRTLAVNKPSSNDPLSHRIIEKRRRDRMNNCLADLSKLIPTYYLKKGRGRIEKTEIIEMAIKYMQHLQAHACSQIETCDITTKQERAGKELEHFQMGYQESMSKTLEFLRDSEGLFSGDSLCVRIMNHLTKHCEKIMKSEGYINPKLHGGSNSSASSSSSGYHANSSSTGSSSDGNGSGSNHGSDCKDVLLTESAYRSDDRLGSDEREDMTSFSSPVMDALDGGGGQNENHSRENFQYPSADATLACNSSYLTSSEPGSNNSSSGDDNVGNRLYKFKSNMKHRFSADAEHTQVKKKRRISESSCCLTDGEECGRKIAYVQQQYGSPSRQDSCQHFSSGHDGRVTPNREYKITQLPPSNSTPKRDPDGGCVPIFALNSSGTFYIPLTIDHSLLGSAMSIQNETSPVLHPVSIYVNFCTSNSLQPVTQHSLSSSYPNRHYHSSSATTEIYHPVSYERRRYSHYGIHSPFNTHSTSGTTGGGEKREYFNTSDTKCYRNGSISEFPPNNHDTKQQCGPVPHTQRETQRVYTPRPTGETQLMRDYQASTATTNTTYNRSQVPWPYQIGTTS